MHQLVSYANHGYNAFVDRISLEEFIQKDDESVYKKRLCQVFGSSKATINNDGTIEQLRKAVIKLDLKSVNWTRPVWDDYFMRLAELASLRSSCMKRRIGCVLVQDNRVVATGYNGTARGLRNCNEGGCSRCNENASAGTNLKECTCLHAEENAILEAGIARAKGGTIYCIKSPCFGCSKQIVQVGIKRVIFHEEYSVQHNVSTMLREAGIELIQLPLPTSKFINASDQE